MGGPLLDAFYVESGLERHAVVATKAASQALSHLLKIAFFALAPLGASAALPAEEVAFLASALPIAIGASFAGTALGARVLDRLSDGLFHSLTRRVVEVLGVACLVRGGFLFFA